MHKPYVVGSIPGNCLPSPFSLFPSKNLHSNLRKEFQAFSLRKPLSVGSLHEVPCNCLEGVAYCTLLISEPQASSGVWLKLALSLLSY